MRRNETGRLTCSLKDTHNKDYRLRAISPPWNSYISLRMSLRRAFLYMISTAIRGVWIAINQSKTDSSCICSTHNMIGMLFPVIGLFAF